MEHAIQINDLFVSYASRAGTVEALKGLSLTIEQGEVVGFLGPNGAGKTTAIHVLLGFIEATSGSAMIYGSDVRDSIARQRIGYLPEHPQHYPFLTGKELLMMAGRLFMIPPADLRSRVENLLQQTGLEEARNRRIGTYSRGMLQRIGLAQALVNDPDLVILDEPTSGLDPLGRLDIRRMIGELKEKGKTVFFSSHELSEVELVCDQVAIVADGKLLTKGKASDLVSEDQNLEHLFVELLQT